MHKRKPSTRHKFLAKRGLKKVLQGKVIDHKIPLKDGGTDTQWNLHLIKKNLTRKKLPKKLAAEPEREDNCVGCPTSRAKSENLLIKIMQQALALFTDY